MKIFEIVPTLSSGGAERLVVDLSNALAEMGHDVSIVTTCDLNEGHNGFYKFDILPNVKTINMKCPSFSPIRNTHMLAKLIGKEKPDIAHFHTTDVLATESLLRYHNTTKHFTTIHNDIDIYFNANGLLSRQGIRRLITRFFGRWKWMRYIAISQLNFDAMTKAYPYCDTRLIYNGRSLPTKTQLFEDSYRELRSLRIDGNSLLFLHIARCAKQKNQRRLIRNFNRLVTEGGINAELLVIGNDFNETELGRNLQALAIDRIHFLGTKPNVWDYILQSDAFILSSDFEGMPISLIEALSCGLPCVSTPVCGVVDLIEDGKNGIISQSFDDNDYYNALLRFVKNHTKIQNQAKTDSQSGKYDIRKTANQYIDFFKNKFH